MADRIGSVAQRIAERMANVATRVAKQQNMIFEGTVLSRNPDGTLNVDDGRGGCARVVPPANYRIGDRIRVGTEPQLGMVTGLPQETFACVSTQPCLSDARLEPPAPTETEYPVAVLSSAMALAEGNLDGAPPGIPQYIIQDWDSREDPIGIEGTESDVFTYRSQWIFNDYIYSGFTVEAAARWLPPAPIQYGFGCSRTFVRVDLAQIMERSDELVSVALRLTVSDFDGAGQALFSHNDRSVHVVDAPQQSNGPVPFDLPEHTTVTGGNMLHTISDRSLASFRIRDRAELEVLTLELGVPTVQWPYVTVALVTDYDLTGTSPPVPPYDQHDEYIPGWHDFIRFRAAAALVRTRKGTLL